MQEISRDLRRLSERMQQIVRDAPDQQRALHERLGETLLDDVRHRAPISVKGHSLGHGEYHERGTLRRWQTKYIGSKGGYAAIRAISRDEQRGSSREIAGAITNYVENGHRVGRAGYGGSARTRRRRRQYGMIPPLSFVNGRGFYHKAHATAARLLTQAAERWADEIARELSE